VLWRQKKYGCLVAIALVAGLIVLACYGFVQCLHKYTLGMLSPQLLVSTNGTEGYQSHFLMEGFRSRGFALFVPLTIKSAGDLKLVADLSSQANYFHSAVWSRDGSVIACRADVITSEDAAELYRPKKDNTYKSKPQYTPYACAYDFREGKSYVFKSNGYHPRSDWDIHSKAIEEVLESRGGLGKEVSKQEIDEESKKLDWTEWQMYQSAMRQPAS
jgi:hypothetical protein